MARYTYVCVNGHRLEVVKAMAEYDRPELCAQCEQQMIHVFEGEHVVFMNGGGLAGTRSQT